MSEARMMYLVAAALGALSLWLLLPRRGSRGRATGAVLGVIALGVLFSRARGVGEWLDQSVFLVLAAITIVSAAATITFRNPVYCAIWFGLTLLGTAGLLFFQGAQFLGVATVTVYAGAILVTFLFVLMLANPKGTAYYDRLTWESWLAAPAAALMVVVLTAVVTRSLYMGGDEARVVPSVTEVQRADEILSTAHMTHLGRRIFSEYLIAIEVAGTLLLVALVGAVAIVAHDKHARTHAKGVRRG
jgi:NADH-quinone oxidoreductase subunit J